MAGSAAGLGPAEKLDLGWKRRRCAATNVPAIPGEQVAKVQVQIDDREIDHPR